MNLSHCGATCCALGLAASLPLFKQIGMRLEQVPDHAEVLALPIGDYAQKAAQRIEDKGAEVGGERDG